MYGKIAFWSPNIRADKPGGGKWQDPVQFTGYIFLAIQADGRAVDASGNAITWAEELRDLTVSPEVPIPLAGFTSADADTRVPTAFQSVQGPGKFEVPQRYGAEGDDIPMISWQELRLIRAEAAGTAAEAIGHIDAIRAAAGLPLVTYGPSTATEITYMIHEEHRRELFSGGARYWSYKIQHPTRAWFPRQEGVTPFQGYNLGGGVRLLFPINEYENNENWIAIGGRDARGTGCAADERPVFN